jgi:hypothetical protein
MTTHSDLWETLVMVTGGDISLSEAHDTILAMFTTESVTFTEQEVKQIRDMYEQWIKQ